MLPDTETIRTLGGRTEYPSYTYKLNPETNHISGYVDNKEAIRQSIFLMLSIERYAWLIYNWYYGVEIDTLIGKNKDYVNTEIQRRIKECLKEDDRILDVHSFNLKNEVDNLYISFIASTIFGDIDYRTEVVL